MNSVKQYNWLQVVEGCSVVSCIVGSILSVVSQQLMYASVPLTVALSLNLINRSKFQQQIRQYNKTTVSEMHQAIDSLGQQVQALPTQNVDLDRISKSLLQVQQTTRTLTEQFNTRPETQEVKQLKTEISELNNLFNTLSVPLGNLPTYTEVNTSEIEHTITNLSSQLDTLTRQVNAKPEVQAIEELKEALNEIKNETEAQVKALQAQLQAFDLYQVNSDSARLQSQINQIIEQYSKTLSFDPNYLEERLTEIERKNSTTYQDNIYDLVSAIRQLQSDKTVTEAAIANIAGELDTLKLRFENLPAPPEPVDVGEIQTSITKLDNQLNALAQDFIARSEPAAIQGIAEIVNRLQEHFYNLPLAPESVDSNELKKFVAGFDERLALLESLNITTIYDELTQLQADIKFALEQLENQRFFQSSFVELSSEQVEGLKQEVEKVKFQILSEFTSKIEQLQQQQQVLEHQISTRQKHLENLDSSVINLQNENLQIRQNVDKYNPQVNKINVLLDKYNQNTIQINLQLETVQKLVNVLDERTNNSPNLDEIQERLDFFQHLMTEYVKTEYLENVLLDLCEEFSKQIDRVVDLQLAEMNQHSKGIQPGDK
jgi:chromosome segregation ATPase